MTARDRIEARDRIVEALRRADEGGYPSAWYFYVDRRDVEAVLWIERTGRIVHGDDVEAPAPATCCGDPGDCGECGA